MRINKNQKVTLTLGQLKRLIKESKGKKLLKESDGSVYLRMNTGNFVNAFGCKGMEFSYADSIGRDPEYFDELVNRAFFTLSDGYVVTNDSDCWIILDPDGRPEEDENSYSVTQIGFPNECESDFVDELLNSCDENKEFDVLKTCRDNGMNLTKWEGWNSYFERFTGEKLDDELKRVESEFGYEVIPSQYRYEDYAMLESKKPNKNQKVALTVGQLKKLVKESTENNADILFNDEDEITTEYEKVFVFVNPWVTVLIGANSKEGITSLLDSNFDFDDEDCAELAEKLWSLNEGGSVEYNRANWYRVR